ncbi:MAG TPA: 3-oxoacyl-[acyl-carrier-protein] synthase III C-terminal domain-containing protein [Solirubrobacteraceae bacterium]|nr:3-oxoacyl-[acyl-carrier-protein] synthase III C-terminal domain-containing protein [Solirubrobacteraceae bacterium]
MQRATAIAQPAPLARTFDLRPTDPRIAAVSVSDDGEVLSQEEVLERLGLADSEFARGIFERCGVLRRHLNLTDDFLARPLQGRATEIEDGLLERSVLAVGGLPLDLTAVRVVVTASLYTVGSPTLAQRLAEHFGLDPSADKYHLSGVGCASAVPLMRLAGQALREHPGGQALVIAADCMSGILTQVSPDDPKAKVIGSAIFGDGCAAALVSNESSSEGPSILASRVHQIEGTLDAVTLALSSEDGYLHLARELPDLAGAGIGDLVDQFLRESGLDRSAVDHWIVHPGGRRIIESVQGALELTREDVAASWDVLAEYGNVGTPSIFYVLKDTLERHRPEPGEHALMVTIGPGVTVGLLLLRW